MSKKVLSIDIQEDQVSMAMVSHGLNGLRLLDVQCLKLAPSQDPGAPLQSLEQTLAVLLEKIGIAPDRCIVSIPARHFFFRTISLPFKTRKNIGQVLAYEIESLLPCAREEITLDFNLLVKNSKEYSDGNWASIAAIQTLQINQYKTVLEACEIHPDSVTVGTGYASALACAQRKKRGDLIFFVHMESAFAALYGIRSNEILLARAFPLDLDDPVTCVRKNILHTFLSYNEQFQAHADLTEIIVSGPGAWAPEFYDRLEQQIELPVLDYILLEDSQIITPPESFADQDLDSVQNAMALCLAEVKGGERFNFNKKISGLGLFLNENRSGLMTCLVLVLLLMVSLTIGPLLGVNALEKRVAGLDARILEVFHASFPEITTIVDPLHQMKTQVEALKKRENMDVSEAHPLSVDLLQAITSALPPDLDIEFTRFVRTQTNLVISGSTDRFNTVDDMKSRLDRVQIFKSVEINSASMDKTLNRVAFNLKILL